MTRIANVNLPAKAHIVIGLQAIYGIGPTRAKLICELANVLPSRKTLELTDEEVERLRQCVSKYEIEGELRRRVKSNIKKKIDLGSYQGRRHRNGLPVHGQRTKTNARTRKGPRKIVGNLKRKESPA